MPLDWDIKYNDVSIKEQITTFNVREVKGAYVRELTLVSPDPSFYDQFSYEDLPSADVEVLTQNGEDWISQGVFYIEKPVLVANKDGSTSPGVWGRSEQAKAGQPFAQKVTLYWEDDTTFDAIIQEMAALVDITITSEIDDYSIVANTYVVDNLYPIEVVAELAEFAGGYVTCTNDGNLIIKQNIYHPSAADHTITDADIADVSENRELPDFGNRVKISASGTGSGYSINLEVLDDSDCIPSDGESTGTFLAFVYDSENEPVNNISVHWEVEEGATVSEEYTNTGEYLITNKNHNADNYNQVTVDYPILSVTGIWAYADLSHTNNLWDETNSGCTFEDNVITIDPAFTYCDQALVVTYVTTGCAVNYVTAGTTALNIVLTADVEGATDEIDVKLGNTCACGSSLNAKVSPTSDVCFDEEATASILIWGTINNLAAAGMIANLTISSGCGELSSTTKILDTVSVSNEVSYAQNTISGVSQAETEIMISDTVTPSVYTSEDTDKTDNLYSSYAGKLIDLNTILDTSTELIIDYEADGAALVSWMTASIEEECDAEITITVADGSEEGLSETIDLSATDCSESEEIPSSSDYWSDDDPTTFDNNEESEASAVLTPCDTAILSREGSIDNALPEDIDGVRFSANNETDCPQEGEDFGCSCENMCESEIYTKGNTYDYSKTIHEETIESYEEGTPEYNEEFNNIQTDHMTECEEKCQETRDELCVPCTVAGPGALAPGESAEYVCSDGTTEMITMPEGACGTQSFTIGCCDFEVRSTDGEWVWQSTYYPENCTIYGTGGCSVGRRQQTSCEYSIIEGGSKREGEIYRVCVDESAFSDEWGYEDYCPSYYACVENQASECDDFATENCPEDSSDLFRIKYYEHNYTWECVSE